MCLMPQGWEAERAQKMWPLELGPRCKQMLCSGVGEFIDGLIASYACCLLGRSNRHYHSP